MPYDLSAEEVRVLGALIEKAATTPNQYPLSINALMHACNQKSAREPVMALTEGDVRAAADRLVRQASGAGGRVSRFEHRLSRADAGPAAALAADELAVLAVLMLRGPQTPGAIRSRAERMAALDDPAAVEGALASLAERDDGPWVERLARGPGEREDRYHHRLGAMPAASAAPSASAAGSDEPAAAGAESLEERVAELERVVEQLQSWIEDEGTR